ncbi:MAG: hypothetical protein AAGB31_07445 [Bdellovibrio sp.]
MLQMRSLALLIFLFGLQSHAWEQTHSITCEAQSVVNSTEYHSQHISLVANDSAILSLTDSHFGVIVTYLKGSYSLVAHDQTNTVITAPLVKKSNAKSEHWLLTFPESQQTINVLCLFR